MKVFAFVLCVAFVTAAPQADDNDDFELPPGMIRCQIDSPDLDECLKEAIQNMLQKLVNGVESLHIPPIEPYVIDSRTLTFSREGFTANITLRKTKVYGSSKAKILDVKSKITKTHISWMLKEYIPEFFVEGFYRGSGRINNLKLKAKGFFNLTATDMYWVARIKGDIITVNGKEYMQITRYDASPQFGDMKLFATGLFPDPELNRIHVEFFNQHWPFIMRQILPQVRKSLEPLFVEVFGKFWSNVPIRKMLYYGKKTD